VATGHEVERYRMTLSGSIIHHWLLRLRRISGFEAAEVNAPEYDLIVIGSGPAGQKGAIAAAKARKSVAVIDRIGMVRPYSSTAGRWSISTLWSSTTRRSPKLTKWLLSTA
jgi:hypothetical protein